MQLKSILVLILLVVFFVVAIAWISKLGGWKSEGCNGNCAGCQARCESKQAEQKKETDDPQN